MSGKNILKGEKALRNHVLNLLRGGGAHVDFERAVADFPNQLCGSKLAGVPHTAWSLIEHMRIAQWDILEFSCNPKHVSPNYPDGYWPSSEVPVDGDTWGKSVDLFRKDLKAMQKLVVDPKKDLFAKIPQGTGQTLLREALLIADHNAYHIGQLVTIRRLLGCWSVK